MLKVALFFGWEETLRLGLDLATENVMFTFVVVGFRSVSAFHF